MSVKNFDWTAPFFGLSHAERDGRMATLCVTSSSTQITLYRRTAGERTELVTERQYLACQHPDHEARARELCDRYLAGRLTALELALEVDSDDPFAGDAPAAAPSVPQWYDESDPEAGRC